MTEPLLTLPVLIAAATVGVGLYLMLPADRGRYEPAVRRTGGGLFGIAFIFLAVYFAVRVDWWPASQFDRPEPAATFAVLACSSIVSAVLTIMARTATAATSWFVLMLVANAGLFCMQRAAPAALATVIGHSILLAAGAFVLPRAAGGAVLHRADRISREPMLACSAGVLLAAALTGAIHRATTVESQAAVHPEAPAWRQPAATRTALADAREAPVETPSIVGIGDFHGLNTTLLAGAALFSLGAVGFLARRNLIVMLLSAGVMLQGVMMTLTAFGAFHGVAAGQMFAGIVLAVTVGIGVLALMIVAVCIRDRGSLDVSLWHDLRDPLVAATVDADELARAPARQRIDPPPDETEDTAEIDTDESEAELPTSAQPSESAAPSAAGVAHD
jgi:NADH-quinone oxidoreductase subunit K